MEKRIVIPGEVVTEKRVKKGSHVYMHAGKIYSDVVGLADDSGEYANVVPLEGAYIPKFGDIIVGVVGAERSMAYSVDINSFYPATLMKRELREALRPGMVISAKVAKVNEVNEVDLSNVRSFYGGEVIEVSPVKVPRLIGRNGSMLEVLKNGTGSSVMVGRNGRIWVNGGNIDLLVRAVNKIDAEAHLENLTNRITAFLEEENKKLPAEERARPREEPAEERRPRPSERPGRERRTERRPRMDDRRRREPRDRPSQDRETSEGEIEFN